ncbi:unnamed protein product [Peniophora sp. CBMAI 1063]|nr:unnamed protein product [Peniophora sp. CBMAI 1063]
MHDGDKLQLPNSATPPSYSSPQAMTFDNQLAVTDSTSSNSSAFDDFGASQPSQPGLAQFFTSTMNNMHRTFTPTPPSGFNGDVTPSSHRTLGYEAVMHSPAPALNFDQVLSIATAEQLYRHNAPFRQLYNSNQELRQEHTALQATVHDLRRFKTESKPVDVAAPNPEKVCFHDLPPYIPDGIDSTRLRGELEAAHRSDPSKPSLRDLFWLEAYFTRPLKGSAARKKAAADPSEPSKRTARGATRLNEGENVNFGFLVRRTARAIDGYELSDLFTTFENNSDWYVARGLWADTPEGFKTMPEVVFDMDMRMRSYSDVFAYCSNSWKFLYMLSYKFAGFYTANTANARRRRAMVTQARADRMLSGEKAYFFKLETDGNDEDPPLPPAKRPRMASAAPKKTNTDSSTAQSTPVSTPTTPAEIPQVLPASNSVAPATATVPLDSHSASPVPNPFDNDVGGDSIDDMYAEPAEYATAISIPLLPIATPSHSEEGMDVDSPRVDVSLGSDASTPLPASLGKNTDSPKPDVSKAVQQDVVTGAAPHPVASTQTAVPSKPPAMEHNVATPGQKGVAQRKKVSDRFASLKPSTPNAYTFSAPKVPATPARPALTSTVGPNLPFRSPNPDMPPASPAPVHASEPDSVPVGAEGSPFVANESSRSDTTTGRSAAYLQAFAEAAPAGGPLMVPRRKATRPSSASAPRRRKWNPGNRTELEPTCGRDWLTWAENANGPTKDDFLDFLTTQYKWYTYCSAKETSAGTEVAAQSYAVKAEALSTLEGGPE